MKHFISEDQVQSALDWLRDNAADIGAAKARAVAAAHMVKHIKAIEAKRRNEMSAARAEIEAMASVPYLRAIDADAKAAGELAEMYSRREAAVLKIEAWRSMSANFRKMSI